MKKDKKKPALHNNTSARQLRARQRLYDLFRSRPFSDELLLTNLGLFSRSSALSKLFFLHEAYSRILSIPGDVFVFGVWLGQDLVGFESMRAMLEPYNASRTLVGFDTFEGYDGINTRDRSSDVVKSGGYSVPADYRTYLTDLLAYHREENVMGHALRHHLVQGDARETVGAYLQEHAESVVALAYFDMALYEPTKLALEAITPRLIPGSVLVMDELNDPRYPGETEALREWLAGKRCIIERSRILPDRTFVTLRP